ncbi:MAG: STAS domain-containing protein [Gammaproteobacteria bacterium]|nr:STAS domain-containing protein [Gammaproteobacteria bacterium]
MSWSVPAALYSAPWPELKRAGIEALEQGTQVIELQAWTAASSAHLAVLLVWWSAARTRGIALTFQNMNQQFQTLARLGGVSFLIQESQDHVGK